jgi:four helix bundle protein
MLAHEKLQVYSKALLFVAAASEFSANWSKKHAVVDQLGRASESLILNLAEGARLRSAPSKLRALDYALGSGLECAACLDIARIKGLLSPADSTHQKKGLSEIVRMLVGLRKAWSTWRTHDESVPYRIEPIRGISSPLFHHETLDVYVAALGLMGWLVSLGQTNAASNRSYWQIDEAATSLILNIAEGNGRYSEVDHRRFLGIAESSAVKMAAYLDLAVQKGVLGVEDCGQGKESLDRIMAMLFRM